MTMYAIDTLDFAKRLRTAGLSQEQAEAIAEAHGQAFREAAEHTLATKEDLAKHPTKQELREELSRFATKEDLAKHPTKQELREELSRFATKEDLADVKAEMKQDVAHVATLVHEQKSSLLIWIIGTFLAFTGVILTGVRLMLA